MLPFFAVGILFFALVFPASRVLLHLGAVTAVGLIAFCVWQIISESASVLGLGILYLALWLIFYWRTAWSVEANSGSLL